MPVNKIKAFMNRIFTPRTKPALLAGTAAVIITLLILKCQKFDRADQDEICQKEKYKKELMLARDSLLLLNKKLDECTGKKKKTVKAAKKSGSKAGRNRSDALSRTGGGNSNQNQDSDILSRTAGGNSNQDGPKMMTRRIIIIQQTTTRQR